jgi:hypothetical protein
MSARPFIAPLAAQYRSLKQVVDSHAADAVLVDLAFTGALPLLAANPRPAVLVCGVGPMTLTSVDTPPFGMAWRPRAAMDYTAMHTAVNRILFRDIENQFGSALNTVGGQCHLPLMDWPRLADRLVQLTVPDFEYPRRDLAPIVEFVGPVLPDRTSSSDRRSRYSPMRSASSSSLRRVGARISGSRSRCRRMPMSSSGFRIRPCFRTST